MKSNGFHIKLLWKTEHERQRAERLADDSTYIEIFPKLSLTQVAEKILCAHIIISVDTGLSHLAAALNQPNITLFGPTDPSLVGGYGKNQYQIVSSTKKMKDITANEIFFFLHKKNMLLKNKLSSF